MQRWSKWSDYAPCTLCSRQNTLLLGKHVYFRKCDNPAPIHEDVLCADTDLSPSLVEFEETGCECDEAEVATTTEAPVETTTTEELPCCEEDDKTDYKMADFNATMLNSTTTRVPWRTSNSRTRTRTTTTYSIKFILTAVEYATELTELAWMNLTSSMSTKLA